MKIKLTDAQKIERIAQKHEDDGWNFYARYSGRAMFGDVCPGIVCPPYDTPKVVTAARRAGIKAYPSHDNMGRDNIVYWPAIKSDPEPVQA